MSTKKKRITKQIRIEKNWLPKLRADAKDAKKTLSRRMDYVFKYYFASQKTKSH